MNECAHQRTPTHPNLLTSFFLPFFFLSRTGNVAVDLHWVCCTLLFTLSRCPTRFKEGFSLSTFPHPFISLLVPRLSPTHPSIQFQVSSVFLIGGSLPSTTRSPSKRAYLLRGEWENVYKPSVKKTTFFSPQCLYLRFIPFLLKRKKRRYLATNDESSSPTHRWLGGSGVVCASHRVVI